MNRDSRRNYRIPSPAGDGGRLSPPHVFSQFGEETGDGELKFDLPVFLFKRDLVTPTTFSGPVRSLTYDVKVNLFTVPKHHHGPRMPSVPEELSREMKT